MTELSEIAALREEVARLHERLDVLPETLRVRSLEAERVTIRESDGTVRLIAASRGSFPDRVQIGGVEIEHARPVAGLLFFNDDGDECGGLVFGGDRSSAQQVGSFTFDRRDGDQVVQFFQEDGTPGRTAGVRVVDQPDVPLPELVEEFRALDELTGPARSERLEQLRNSGLLPTARVFVGRGEDGEAAVVLHDEAGRPRLRLRVSGEGQPTVEGLDEAGAVVWSFP